MSYRPTRNEIAVALARLDNRAKSRHKRGGFDGTVASNLDLRIRRDKLLHKLAEAA